MCCLKYENESYEQAREDFPEVGCLVVTPDGDGKVAGINIFKDTVSVELRESKIIKEYSCEDIVVKDRQAKNGRGCKKDCPLRLAARRYPDAVSI
jgi:uncharacterized protein YuzE